MVLNRNSWVKQVVLNGLVLLGLPLSAQNKAVGINASDSANLRMVRPIAPKQLEIPLSKSAGNLGVYRYSGFTLQYNEVHEQADWVAYQLTEAETRPVVKRSDKFLIDPKIKSGSATHADYLESGYDRGHLAPAADMSWSMATMQESFYYSNMSPQFPSFNRGIWKRLEEQVRDWARQNDTIYVVTGPVLQADLPQIGPNRVSVPRYFYKVLLDYSEPSIKGIGFVMPNAGSTLGLASFAVSIDSVERLTGLDFFPKLPDAQETMLERTVCLSCWQWSGSNSGVGSTGLPGGPQGTVPNSSEPRVPTVEKLPVSVQCSGITQSGVRCKRKTTNPNGRCYQH